MDTPELPDSLKAAGREYYDSLIKLGLNPEGFLWAYHPNEETFHLWLIWSGLDQYGPLAMSKLLFRAYNASALPREIDPFSVWVVNTDHYISTMSVNMREMYPKAVEADALDQFALRMTAEDGTVIALAHYNWAYHLQDKRNNAKKINRDWKIFNANVRALAA